MTPRHFIAICLTSMLSLCSIASPELHADVLMLESGGQLRGQLLNRDESPRKTYVVRTELGAVVTLDRDQVERIVYQSPEELQYEKMRTRYPDTVEGHWELVEWCRENRLDKARQVHLERIIQLDPDHEEARRLLGYQKYNGRWMTREEEMALRGFKFYDGRYRTPQEIELMERDKKQRLAERQWHSNLKRWRDWLDSDRRELAKKNILEIDDPHATPALKKYLEEEQHRAVKLLYIEALTNLRSGSALQTLIDTSLDARDDEVRLTCLDYIAEEKPPAAVAQYIQALKSKDNVKVNRAAQALGMIGNPQAISPLINAMVTEHKYIVNTGGQPGQMSSTFSPSGGPGGGLRIGGGPKTVTQQHFNQSVLNALIVLSDGQNYGRDQDAWRNWYILHRRSQVIDTRRD